MSLDVDVKIFDSPALIERLAKWGAIDRGLVINILKRCGTILYDKYIIVNNEHADDYNPWSSLIVLLEAAFKKPNVYRIIDPYPHRDRILGITHGVECREIADELGFKIADEEDESY